MIKKDIFQPLPFYNSTEKKNRFKEQCHNDICTFKLIMECDRIIPFVLIRDPNPSAISAVTMYCYDNGTSYDLTAEMVFTYLSVIIDGVYKDEIQYFGGQISEQAKGLMYLKIEDGTNTWYSEDFYIECCFNDDEAGNTLLINSSDSFLINSSGDKLKHS